MSQRVKSPAEDAPAASERLRVFLRARPLTSEEVRGKVRVEEAVRAREGGPEFVWLGERFSFFGLRALALTPGFFLKMASCPRLPAHAVTQGRH